MEKEYKLIKDQPLLLRLQQLIKEKFNKDVNHCIVTLYQNQNDHIKYHSDDPKTIDPSTPIFFFSLGYQRPLALRPAWTKSKNPLFEIPMEPGSLL